MYIFDLTPTQGDEAMFMEEMGKHRKNDGYWSIENPYLVDEMKHQGQIKYMVNVFTGSLIQRENHSPKIVLPIKKP